MLVVEDDEGLRETLAAILEFEGYDVRQAQHGLEALAQLEAAPADVVVLDLMMPLMDGYRFTEELIARGMRGDVALLVLTADGRAAEKGARLGAEAALAKPFELRELLELVSTLERG